MIMLTKEQLADLLRAAYRNGFEASAEGWNFEYGCMEPESSKYWLQKREEDIQPLFHRSSGGHDDHGREVK